MKDVSHITKDILIDAIYEKVTNAQIIKFLNIGYDEFNFLKEKYNVDSKKLITPEMRKRAIRKKVEETTLERYGVTNGAKTDFARKKIKEKAYKKDLSHITKELLVDTIKNLKTIPRIIRYLDIQRHMLDELLFKYEINYDSLVSEKEYKQAILERREQTNNLLYGVPNAMQSEKLKEKLKIINEEKYGTEYLFSSNYFKEKRKKTMLEKYGTEHALLDENLLTKAKETNQERYGHENAFLNAEVQEKHRQTMLEKYSVTSPFLSTEIRKKQKETWLNKYGVDNPRKSPSIKEKIIDTKIKNGTMYVSSGEKEIREFISEIYVGEVKYNVQNIIDGELDIYISAYKIAIEFNGMYWHSTEYKDENYHFDKSRKCDKEGIRLIHVFETLWNNPQKRAIYKQLIANALGSGLIKIRAKKCEIKELDSITARDFFNDNHLGGYVASKINYGLYYNDELIQVEMFSKPRFDQKIDWESTRGCSKLGYMIYGGYEKILKHFVNNFNVKSIISYVDFNVFKGALHEHAGFRFSHYTGPDHWYLNKKGELKRYWIVRGKKEDDLEWAKQRELEILYHYYFAGSKVYFYNKSENS